MRSLESAILTNVIILSSIHHIMLKQTTQKRTQLDLSASGCEGSSAEIRLKKNKTSRSYDSCYICNVKEASGSAKNLIKLLNHEHT